MRALEPPARAAEGPRAALRLGVALLASGLALAATACSEGGARTGPPDPEARAQALIDAGNRAYGAGDFGLAARRYAAAAVDHPDDPAAFYGLGMALAKLGRDEEARAAYAKARELQYRSTEKRPGG